MMRRNWEVTCGDALVFFDTSSTKFSIMIEALPLAA